MFIFTTEIFDGFLFLLLAIGDRILIAPQTSGRIVTLPDAEIAMIQLDHVLSINGSMISNGTLTDHTHYVNVNNFEWDSQHEYWKPKFTSGDKITLQMTTVKNETPKPTPPPPPPRTITPKVSDEMTKRIIFEYHPLRYTNPWKENRSHRNCSICVSLVGISRFS